MFKFWPNRRGKANGAPQAQVAATTGSASAPRTEAQKKVDPEALLRRLEWTVIRRLDGLLQGDYRTLLRGFGLDLADLREYQAHDDVRYIDWNATARLQTPQVREFQEDREIAAWFLLDLSGSVDFGSQYVRKRAISAELVGVLARLLTRHGNRVGAVLYGDGANMVLPARGGRRQVLHLLERMLRMGVQADAQALANAPGKETDLSQLLDQAQQLIKRRSVIFVVSDFISTPGWAKRLTLLARRHEIVAVRLYDPMERELPDLGLIVLQDAETREQIFVDTHDRGFRKRFAQTAERRETALRAALVEAGVDCLELATDDNLGEALLRFTELRKMRSRLAGGGVHKPMAG
jgi:uncharacterized protein (DUF58 family)